MHACIICLAVLSSLLNLTWVVTSETNGDESTEDDSTESPTDAMDLQENGGNTFAQWNRRGCGHLNTVETEDKLLLVILSVLKLVFIW